MTEHQRAAYTALHDTAETLRALVSGARSYSHQLELNLDTVLLIGDAINALHAAQRTMEKTK